MIQSPASRAARRRSCQVRSVSAGERALEEPEGEPARLELGLAQEAVGDEQSGVGRSSRVASRKPRETAARSGQRTPWIGPMPGRDAVLALVVLGIGEAAQAAAQGGGERVGVAESARRGSAPRASARP